MQKYISVLLAALAVMLAGIRPARAQATISGTHLQAYSGNAILLYDATNEVPASVLGHIVTLTSAGGFPAGTYICPGTFVNAGHNMFGLYNVTAPFAPVNFGTLSGGTWSYSTKAAGTANVNGNNLTQVGGQGDAGTWWYDSETPFSSAMIGKIITISGGTNFTNSGQFVVAGYVNNNNFGAWGQENGINLWPIPTNATTYASTSTTTIAYGGVWTVTGGNGVPPIVPVPAYTGSVRVICIGDSITQLQGNGPLNTLQTQFPNASSYYFANKGVGGITSAGWLPGSSYLADAVTTANANGVTVINIMLGTNDAKTAPIAAGPVGTVGTHAYNIQAITNSLFAQIPTLRKVIVQEHTALLNGAVGWTDGTSDAALSSYYATYSGLTGVTVGVSGLHAYSAANTQDYRGDSIHPNGAGITAISYYWSKIWATAIPAAVNTLFRHLSGARPGSRSIQ